MKKLLVIFLILSSLFSYSQSETHNFITYDTVYNYQADPFHTFPYQIRISRPVNMFTAGNADTASRPAIITMPGQGEMGTDPAKLQVFGPHYWLNNGWDGGVVLANGTHYPILITMICSATQPDPSWNSAVLKYLLNTYHIKRNSVHLAGLSQGAFTWSAMITYESVAGNESGMQDVTSLTLLSGAATATGSYKLFGHWAKKYKGKLFATVGYGDAQITNPPLAERACNDSVPGSAYFTYNTIGGGSHCCWNTDYDPNLKSWQSFAPLGTYVTTGSDTNSRGTYKQGSSIFQWMLRQGDTTLVGQAPAIKEMVPMEYWCPWRASNDTMYGILNGSVQAFPLPGGLTVKAVSGAFNLMRVAANNGTVWQSTQYNVSPLVWSQIINDTNNVTITDAINIRSFADLTVITRANGSLWMYGNDTMGLYHALGTRLIITKPIQFSPSGVVFQDVAIGDLRLWGLDVNGKIYEWKRNQQNRNTTILNPSSKALKIAIGHFDYAGAIIANTSGDTTVGQPYVIGSSYGDWGSTVAQNYTILTSVQTLWGIPNPIKELNISWNSTQAIDVVGDLYSIGYNPQGEVGIGDETVNKYFYSTFPGYGWTFSNFENAVIAPMRKINSGVVHSKIYGNGFFSFYKYAQDVNGNLYAWGRGKTGVLNRGLIQVVQDNTDHPNALDLVKPTLVTPQTQIIKFVRFIAPSIFAGPTQNIGSTNTTLTGSGFPCLLINNSNNSDTVLYTASNYLWTRISGTGTIVSPNSKTTAITGMSNGTNIFQLTMTDNNGGQDTSQVKVIVNTTLTPPTVSAGNDKLINLPTNSITFNGTANGNGGATITGYNWTQINGPSTATLSGNNTLNLTVSNLVVGTYTFRLTVTDSNNQTSFSDVKVTVTSIINAIIVKRGYRKRFI